MWQSRTARTGSWLILRTDQVGLPGINLRGFFSSYENETVRVHLDGSPGCGLRRLGSLSWTLQSAGGESGERIFRGEPERYVRIHHSRADRLDQPAGRPWPAGA